MNELLTLNVFALSTPMAALGVGLLGAVIAWPWFARRAGSDGRA